MATDAGLKPSWATSAVVCQGRAVEAWLEACQLARSTESRPQSDGMVHNSCPTSPGRGAHVAVALAVLALLSLLSLLAPGSTEDGCNAGRADCTGNAGSAGTANSAARLALLALLRQD